MAPAVAMLQKLATRTKKNAPAAAPQTALQQETTVQQAIKQQQSFELVQTLLLVSVTSLVYLRNLLPIHCFEDRDYDSIRPDAHWPFKDFASQAAPSQELCRASPSLTDPPITARKRQLKVLVRGRSPRSDKLLFWLDGIFESLEKGYLESVQFSVFLNNSKPDEVVESYTFSFAYRSADKPEVDGVIFSDSQGKSVTIKNARYGLNMIIKYLVQVAQTLPDLPETRFLTAHLFYNDSCPDEYNPPGFRRNDSEEMMVPETPLWGMREDRLGEMDAGFHCVGLKVASLSAVGLAEGGSYVDVPIPSNLPYTKSMPRRSERLAISSAVSASLSGGEQSPSCSQDSPVTQRLDDSIASGKNRFTQDVISSTNPGYGQDTQDNLVQSSTIIGRKCLIQAQDKTSQESGVVEKRLSRELKEMIRAPTQESGLVPTQQVTNDCSNLLGQTRVSMNLATIKNKELGNKRAACLEERRLLPVPPIRKTRCECGLTEKEGQMIQCDCCEDRQHKHCYGLDFCEPNAVHVCYICLLGDNEDELLQSMRRVAKLRRIFYHIRTTNEPKTDLAYSKQIGCEIRAFRSAVRRLKDEGIILDTPGSHSSGFTRQGRPRYLALEDKVKSNFDKGGLLHPLSGIAYHYNQLPPDKDLGSSEERDKLESVGTHDGASSTEGETDELLGARQVIPASQVDDESMPPPPRPKSGRIAASVSPVTPQKRSNETRAGRGSKRFQSSNARSPLNGIEDLFE